jgi:hypothetical protein
MVVQLIIGAVGTLVRPGLRPGWLKQAVAEVTRIEQGAVLRQARAEKAQFREVRGTEGR